MSNSSNNILKTGYVLNDKWVIIELIGKGAMGEVYRAHQLNLKRDVAIKVISQEMLESFEDDPTEIETAVLRFRREVQAMGQLRHPNVLQIIDYGSDVIFINGQDVPIEYIIMEYIPGATLRFTMSEEGFYPEQDLIASWLVEYFLPLLEGVEAIHARNIVHRDLKPENILLDNKVPKIADFGLACSVCMKPVTQSLDIRGTPAYMSPEHFFDFKNADRQSDIYSLGKILYEAIDGKITSKILPFKSVALANPGTTFLQKLNQIIIDATAEEKDKRFKSIGDLRNPLSEALDIYKRKTAPDRTVTSGPLSFLHQPLFIWSGIVIAVLSVTLMGLWHLMGEPSKSTALSKSPKIVRMVSDQPVSSDASKAEQTPLTPPAQSILGNDGIIMLLIPGGELEVKTDGLNAKRQTVRIQPFYIGQMMVTNHHFVEFLNEVKADLTVENGVVNKNGEIWFYTGKGTELFDQIIYKHGLFHLRDIKYAVYPVVRVTWYGAAAYAHYYGKRLLSATEWDYLFSRQSLRGVIVGETSSTRGETNDTELRISAADISDMTTIEKNFKEWIIRDHTDPGSRIKNGSDKNDSYSSMIGGKFLLPESGLKSYRYPWEAFYDVGFRCAIGVRP